jgi:hypothetical protein|tara:strand:- start:515 stop:1156 length:642 start_codon:yes stop_codon:yes gene_type:complete
MITINNGSLSELLKSCDTGPFMQAQIFSLTGLGNLRVQCNWLYSALNVDPGTTGEFLWSFNKIDDNHISLSPPTGTCISKPLFASARDDNQYFMQVQAPFSADWITSAQRDETFYFEIHDLNMAVFKGFNGSYFQVDNAETSHGNWKAYRIRSIGNTVDKNTQWYIKIKKSIQEGVNFIGIDYSPDGVRNKLVNSGIDFDAVTLDKLVRQISD